jgi:TRAP-type mannitol/chloroaromatic compound transport system permease small subunit
MWVIDAAIARIVAAASWLVLPLSLLLFLQWPLREFVRAYSREANDLGQVLFALYVAVAVTAATRRGTHLAMDMAAHRYTGRTRRVLLRLVQVTGVLPWAAFVLAAGRSLFWGSAQQLERFSDTGNPGYFLVKFSAGLLAGMMILQGALTLFRPQDGRS